MRTTDIDLRCNKLQVLTARYEAVVSVSKCNQGLTNTYMCGVQNTTHRYYNIVINFAYSKRIRLKHSPAAKQDLFIAAMDLLH